MGDFAAVIANCDREVHDMFESVGDVEQLRMLGRYEVRGVLTATE
jgi:hypothetical protein